MFQLETMKRIFLLLLGITWSVAAYGEKSFEGHYTMELTADKETVMTDFWVKDGHMRMSVTNRNIPGEMIIRSDSDKMLVLIPQQKMYIEVGIPKIKDELPSGEEGTEDSRFKKTGKTREILGYEAHEFTYEDGNDQLTIWATEELGAMTFGQNPVLQPFAANMLAVTGLKAFFPLEATSSSKGKQSFRMQVKTIEKKKLDDSQFKPPSDYRVMTMPTMPGGMGR